MCQSNAKFLAQLYGARACPGSRRAGGRLGRVRAPLVPLAVVALSVAFATGCESGPARPTPPTPHEASGQATTRPDPAAFSGLRAFGHLKQLAAIGPRQTGSRGASRARRYLERALAATGAHVEELRLLVPVPGAEGALAAGSEPGFVEAVHLVALLPGRSKDRFLLAAAYDTRDVPGIEFVGANASASGAALLLELTRVLSLRARPYTLMIVLLDADALPARTPGTGFPGTRAFAAYLAEAPDLGFERIRLAVVFQQVGDADLSIARDLRSHQVYREFFWEAAGVLGRGASFPPDARVESVNGSHIELIEAGLPRTVLISDPRFGGPDVPGRYAASASDTPERCSPKSLEAVGEVTVEALDRIATRLSRIDRFRAAPLEGPLGPERGSGQPE